MADQRVSMSEALRFAGAFWRRATPRAWAPLLVLGLVTFLLSPAFHVAMALTPVLVVVNIAMLVLADGALMRVALADRHPDDSDYRIGPAGLQWGRIETSLLGALLLLALFFFLATIGAVFVVMLVTVVISAVTGQGFKPGGDFLATPAGMAGAGALLVVFLLILWAGLRLYLATAATVDRKRAQVFATWTMTGGQVLPLLGAVFVVTLPTLVLSLAARTLAGADGPANGMALGLWLLYGLVFAFAYTPLGSGVGAYFYRQLDASPE